MEYFPINIGLIMRNNSVKVQYLFEYIFQHLALSKLRLIQESS